MSIAKLLQRHQASLEEARKALERTRVDERDLQLGEALKKRRIAEVSARIAALEAERRAVTERIDRAIAAEKEALAMLERASPLPQRSAEEASREQPKPSERKTPPTKRTTSLRSGGKSGEEQPRGRTATRRKPKT